MLAGGVLTSALVWRLLMLEPTAGAGAPERLSAQDRQALERVLGERTRP
jgi:hypothetical protein